ncbi:MAG: glycosyltransferase family 39 protein [Deltaproteobacteria bacterium]|nr:glycosyltransferase family 39 protein [Deltaproteobacteria bacterium]
MMTRSLSAFFLCIGIALFAALLRLYTLGLQMPYFYQEDEGHHFNRTVNMVKRGEMNPHYFNKPSLHFYIRMPAVLAGYAWEKSRGRAQSLDDIRTYNRYGLAGYAYTASHPNVVKAVRAVSVLLGVALVVLTFLTAKTVTGSIWAAAGSSLLTAVSPDLIKHSGIIGVDILMAAMCWAAVYIGLVYLKSGKPLHLILCAVFAGLAISSKYNALPIIAVPGLAVLLSGAIKRREMAIAAAVPLIAFFAASPFILIELDRFVKDIGYEVWHYSVAGHEGHTASPGIEQAIFYLLWLSESAIGPAGLAASAAGLALMLARPSKATLLFLSFPLLLFLEMILQKANFTRNMIAFIPFIAISASAALAAIRRRLPSELLAAAASLTFVIIIIAEPLSLSLNERATLLAERDSRDAASEWLNSNLEGKSTAISGQIMMPPHLLYRSDVRSFDQDKFSSPDLFLDGYDRIVTGHWGAWSEPPSYLMKAAEFDGVNEKERIVKNPAIVIYDLRRSDALLAAVDDRAQLCTECSLPMREVASGKLSCSGEPAEAEQFCWIGKRVVRINLPSSFLEKIESGPSRIDLEIMTPWPGQTVRLWHDSSPQEEILTESTPGRWENVSVLIDKTKLSSPSSISLYVEKLQSPFKAGLSQDKRLLGAAVKTLTISSER